MARKQMNIRLDRNTIEIIKAIGTEYDMSEGLVITQAVIFFKIDLERRALNGQSLTSCSSLPEPMPPLCDTPPIVRPI